MNMRIHYASIHGASIRADVRGIFLEVQKDAKLLKKLARHFGRIEHSLKSIEQLAEHERQEYR